MQHSMTDVVVEPILLTLKADRPGVVLARVLISSPINNNANQQKQPSARKTCRTGPGLH
jgi:hypothetical protein